MTRIFGIPALALGAALAANGVASADDAPRPSTTMTLGGKGTAAQAATEDGELTHGRGYRGYYGWGGGYGYRGGFGYGGFGYGGFRTYYGGFNSFYSYRPAFYGNYYSFGYRPAFYYSSFYYPTYSSFYYPSYYSYGYGSSFYLGIGGGLASGAPTVTLGESFARPAVPPMTAPSAPGDGTFPYDGGPANPVPLPKGDPQAIPPANPSSATDLPISLKPKPAPTQYKYKAYGEK